MSETPAALRGLSDAEAVEEAYRQFGDVTEILLSDPIAGHSGHPAGRIVRDRGAERFAFLCGYRFAKAEQKEKGNG